MEDRPPPSFQPKRLDRFDLANPMNAPTRRLPPQDASRLHGERLDQARRLGMFSPHVRRRISMYALGGAVTFPVLHGFFRFALAVGPGLDRLWLQLPLGAVLGAVIAFLRPARGLCGFLVAGAALILGLLCSAVGLGYMTVLYLAVWFCLGMAVGIDEEMRREEGM